MIEVKSGVLGYPRIGRRRELKWALERCWSGQIDEQELLAQAQRIRLESWTTQARSGASWVAVCDFSLYDHVLDLAFELGAIPARFGGVEAPRDMPCYFALARGKARGSVREARPLEMTKWFDTNYHYLVPELEPGMRFEYRRGPLFAQVKEACELGFPARPALLGPVSFLLSSKASGGAPGALSYLGPVLTAYRELLMDLRSLGIASVQLDEPCLVTDLPPGAAEALVEAYAAFAETGVAIELVTYFGDLRDNLDLSLGLPVHSLHVDALASSDEARLLARRLRPDQALSVGLIDGRNVWRADLRRHLELAEELSAELGSGRLMIAPTCSLLHVPVDVRSERTLDPEIAPWLSFAEQKLGELSVLARALSSGRDVVRDALASSDEIAGTRRTSPRRYDRAVRDRLAGLTASSFSRSLPLGERRVRQRLALRLPPLPTTTIGSFPQTRELRELRARHKAGELTGAEYDAALCASIDDTLSRQEQLGLDVLVHGEPERNDMVEYFAEQLEGMLVTSEGWVQSYGSRCVKPPILYGDVRRRAPMTLRFATYAQSRSKRPVKGMLTGPVTLLKWSFVRDDEPLEHSCRTLALALGDELAELERAGIAIIQVDEPAFREAVPLRLADRARYLEWSVQSFRLATSRARPETQIHTHMCYSEFSDLLDGISALDADVISLEAARSAMEVADAFVSSGFAGELGLGVWDIHSPRVPPPSEMLDLVERALSKLDPDRMWINPDCGLKTRSWDEVTPALTHLVQAAKVARERLRRA